MRIKHQPATSRLVVPGPQKLLFLVLVVLLVFVAKSPRLDYSSSLRTSLVQDTASPRRLDDNESAPAFVHQVKQNIKQKYSATTNTIANTNTTNDSVPRIFILPGPHKTGSTSIQKFFAKLQRKGVLNTFGWSWVGEESSKGMSIIARHLLIPPHLNDNKGPEKSAKIAKHFGKEATRAWQQEGKNLIVAAEFLDYVAALPAPESRQAVRRLQQWLVPPSSTEDKVQQHANIHVVVAYRTPRIGHLVSAWNQAIRSDRTNFPWRTEIDTKKTDKEVRRKQKEAPPTVAEWLCTGTWTGVMTYNISAIISAQVNPWGVAAAYQQHLGDGVQTMLLDMAGVADQDIANVVACDAMHLPCFTTNKTLANNPRTGGGRRVHIPKGIQLRHVIETNHRKAPDSTGFDEMEQDELEQILQDMDCYYYCQMGADTSASNFSILYPTSPIFAGGRQASFEACCRRVEQRGPFDGVATTKRIVDVACRAHQRSSTADQ